jgi:ribosomal protein S18 acetylase RimI-like enzyme
MHLDRREVRALRLPPGVEVRLASPEDDLAELHGVAALAFSVPGTAVGTEGHDEAGPDLLALVEDRMRRELTITAIALVDGRVVAVGSHNPIGDATEIVGVGVLPTHRRRGLGAAVTAALVRDALARGTTTVVLSAGDEEVSRVYARVGFRVVGTAGAASPPSV